MSMDTGKVIDCRRIEEKIVKALMIASTLFILAILVLILATVIVKGLPTLSLAMITQAPKGGYYLGQGGGILNAILGSLSIGGGAVLLAIMISLPVVLYLNIYARESSRLTSFTRFSFDVLWGVPSIVYGAFGFAIMLYFGLRASLLGGILAVTLLILPIMSRTMDEVVRMVPEELLEVSYSLGATKLEAALKVVVRQTLPGLLTAVLIAFGRGIGDAASVMFTAGFTDYVPTSLLRPAATLPLAIFFQVGTPIPEVQGRAYASAFILTMMILAISIVTRVLTRRFTRHVLR
ncbi:MAG: ABC transporter permease subunit [bacterium]